ncbi:hypothetical protein CHU98_g7793 [Xylaria longipes]|nr:hypothetical protein CHU98_g7793 [Xylaria longipes]
MPSYFDTMSSSAEAVKDGNSSSSDLGEKTQISSGDTAKTGENSSGTSGQSGQIYKYRYRGKIISAEEAATLDPMETMRLPGIEPPPEESSPTKCDCEGSEQFLGIEGVVHGKPMPFRRWDGKTRDHIVYQCYECWVALGHPHPGPPPTDP